MQFSSVFLLIVCTALIDIIELSLSLFIIGINLRAFEAEVCVFWGIYRVLWVPNIGDRARRSTNLLLRMKLRWSERPNLGLPPERYGWSPREKIRATEDQARGARIRQEMLLAEERGEKVRRSFEEKH